MKRMSVLMSFLFHQPKHVSATFIIPTPSPLNRTKCALSPAAPACQPRAPLKPPPAFWWNSVTATNSCSISVLGSAERISSLVIPYNFLNKVFIGHLHTDHFGGLHDLFIGGALMGRNVPLRVWGPSGQVPELGTKYAMDGMMRMLNWDLSGRVGMTDFRGYQMEVNEFDYKGENKIIFEENGVVVRSFPAIHSIDGSVSFSLEWNGLKFVFGSDSYPNKWFDEYAKDADLAIHECFIAVPDLVAKAGWTPEMALMVGTQIHTAPEAFGKVMSGIKPRMAVAYHFFKDFDTTPAIYERIRQTYDGPLSLAEDYMVWNVTKDEIRTRLAVVDHHTWGPPPARKSLPGNPADKQAWAKELGLDSLNYSTFISEGKMDMNDVIRPIYKEASESLGSVKNRPSPHSRP